METRLLTIVLEYILKLQILYKVLNIDFYTRILDWIEHDEQEHTCEKRWCDSVFRKLLSNDFNIIELLENDERERQMLEVKSEHEMI